MITFENKSERCDFGGNV